MYNYIMYLFLSFHKNATCYVELSECIFLGLRLTTCVDIV